MVTGTWRRLSSIFGRFPFTHRQDRPKARDIVCRLPTEDSEETGKKNREYQVSWIL